MQTCNVIRDLKLMRYTFILIKVNRKSRRVSFLMKEPKKQEDNNAVSFLPNNMRTNLTFNVFLSFLRSFILEKRQKERKRNRERKTIQDKLESKLCYLGGFFGGD